MVFPHPSRAALAAVVLALVAPTALGVLSGQPVYQITLIGQTTVALGQPAEFSGKVVADRSSAVPVPLAFQRVSFTLDGVEFGTTTTDVDGSYRVSFTFPARGSHSLIAWIQKGNYLETRSPPKAVNIVVPPTLLDVRVETPPVPGHGTTRVSWDVDDGGYPIFLFRIWRSVNGGPFLMHANVSHANSYYEPTDPGVTYAYRIVAFNYAGTSAPLADAYTTPTSPITGVTITSIAASMQCTVPHNYDSCPAIDQLYTTQLRITGTTSGAGAGRLVQVNTDTALYFPCTGGSGLCPVQARLSAHETLVKTDGTFDTTVTFNWMWPGGTGATALNPYPSEIVVDGIAATGSVSLSITSGEPCGTYGCGGWG